MSIPSCGTDSSVCLDTPDCNRRNRSCNAVWFGEFLHHPRVPVALKILRQIFQAGREEKGKRKGREREEKGKKKGREREDKEGRRIGGTEENNQMERNRTE